MPGRLQLGGRSDPHRLAASRGIRLVVRYDHVYFGLFEQMNDEGVIGRASGRSGRDELVQRAASA